MPSHGHTLRANADFSDVQTPANNRSIARSQNANAYRAPSGQPVVDMAPEAVAPIGASQPHNNLQPYLTFYFNIALQGVFPPRS